MRCSHLRERRSGDGIGSAVGRSLETYYRDRARTERMHKLNALFVTPGSRVFDIGAHVGDRTGSFLCLGASVVALEPQPRVFRALRLIYGRCDRAALLPVAAGGAAGNFELHVNSRNLTVATLSGEFVAAAAGAEDWQDETWDRRVSVEVTTIDALVARYGEPDFVKIDVEGHEAEVLKGLSRPLAALSFEFTTIQRDAARLCFERLARLGQYEFNLSLGEEHKLCYPSWRGPEAMWALIANLPHSANSGDVYARLT
jgi:FkbM family methyltransferase